MPDLDRLLRDFDPGAPPPLDLAVARAQRLVDVTTAHLDTPVGPLLLAATERGLVRIVFLRTQDEEAVLDGLVARISRRVVADPAGLADIGEALQRYLAGDDDRLDLPVDLRLASPFRRTVLDAARRIPYGEVTTYGALAGAIGRPRAARAVGRALGANPVPIVVPCHRIVPTAGGIGGYVGGAAAKERLLALEAAGRRPDRAGQGPDSAGRRPDH